MSNTIFELISAIGLILLIATLFLLLRISIIQRRKNHRMMDIIKRMIHYRSIVIQNGDPDEMDKNTPSNYTQEEFTRFKEVDKRIMKERLFANPDFGRDDLMHLMGVDKNTLPGIINNITGYNVPGYINTKRMEYAVLLIRKHPEYTLDAIAEACGIKSQATFIRNFKASYDMTPSEFRKQLREDTTPPQLTPDNTEDTSY